ncbi:MAG: hypothetical protein K8W52_47210 [Deltaproteobacteria bacterium]|nr:hypothetical protein [Deltaproteobacteria bacterium]
MRVVHVAVAAPTTAVFLVADRFAVVLARNALRVVDVRDPAAPVGLTLHDVVHAAAVHDHPAFVTVDRLGTLARWELRGGAWAKAAAIADQRCERGVVASPSGRFAVLDGSHAALVDLDAGRVVTELPGMRVTARPCFARDAGDRELLFVAAPSYMDVRVIDAAAGVDRARHEHAAESFCHVAFRLAAGGTRLVAFGCMWGGAYEAVIYDVGAWLAAATPPIRLPGRLATFAPIAGNVQLALDVAADGVRCTSACLEAPADLAPDDDGDVPVDLERLRTTEPDLARALEAQAGGPGQALIVRAVDPVSGRTTAAAVHPVPAVPEAHIHYADDHRVVLVGARLLVCDAHGARVDHGPVVRPDGAHSCVTRDATIVVIASGPER